MTAASFHEAQALLDALEPGGKFTFQSFDDSSAKRPELAKILHGTLKSREAQLQRLNADGAGIFVTVNETDGNGREYRNIKRVRALFVDLDGSPIEPVRTGPLMPHLVVESSPGRWHAYWLVDDVALEDFRPLQRGLIKLFGGDKACIDLPRVMRLPGFWHRKAEEFQTHIADFNEAPRYKLDQVLKAFGWATAKDAEPTPKPVPAAPAPPRQNTDGDVGDDLREALRSLSADEYATWIAMGHALKTFSAGKFIWLEWSSTSTKYNEADALKRWEGFHPGQTSYQAVFSAAKQHGWDPANAPSVKRKRSERANRIPPPRPSRNDPTPPPESANAENSSAPEPAQPPALDASEAGLVQRFELVYGTKQVWDTALNMAMSYSSFAALVGKAAATAWMDGGKRRVRMVAGAGKPPEKKKRGREETSSFKLDWMLPRYALIYGTEAVFDRSDRRELSLGALRAFAGLKATRDWGDHPKREVVREDQVIFDPGRALDDPTVCNLWGGWPIVPEKGSAADQDLVDRWLKVLFYACNESDAITDWVLKWIAYPLKYPGTKMTTSIVMHGPEGSGKNTIWDAVRRIYGSYGRSITQTQLEQQWTDWISAVLFVVGNEVLHRQEQIQQKGRLKSLVTEPTLRVERKFLPGRTEQNFAQLVFLSNETVPLSLDPEDRRNLVIWTPPAHPSGREFYAGLGERSMPDSTVRALYHYLLQVPLDDFDAHTKPPMTQAKADLIEASLESHHRFIREWMAGALPIPCQPCTSRDLYHAYQFWCREYGERFPKPENKFAARAKKEVSYGNKRYITGTAERQGICYLPSAYTPPPNKPEYAWLGESIDFFREAFRQWKDAPGC